MDKGLARTAARSEMAGIEQEMAVRSGQYYLPLSPRKSSGDVKDESRFEKEKLAFHERVRKGYKELANAEKDRFVVVKAMMRPGAVYESVKADLLKFIKRDSQ